MSLTIKQLQALINGDGSTNLIYNRYQRSDYAVGLDNLNPRRELDITSSARPDDTAMLLDIQNMRALLYDMYRKRLEEMRAKEGTLSNVASDLGIPYADREKSEAPLLLQETATGYNKAPSPERDLAKMLGALSALLGADVITSDGLPFDICAGINDAYDKGLYDDLLKGNTGGGTADSSIGGSGSGGLAGGSGTSGSGAGVQAINDDLACFMHELGILQLLLSLVDFMNYIAKIQREVLSVVFMIVRIVTLVAQCWVNPAALAEVAQELANQGIAWAAELLQQLIQSIWDSLNLDCLVKQSLSAVSEIMGSVGLVADSGAQAGTFLKLTNQAFDEIGRTGTLAREAFASKTLKEAYNDAKNAVKSGVGNAILDSLNSMSAVRKVRAARDNLARVISGAASTTADITSDIQLGAQTLGVKADTAIKRANAAEYERRSKLGYYYITDSKGNQERVNLTQEEMDQYAADAAQLRQSVTKEAVEDKLQAVVDSAEETREGMESWGDNMGAAATSWVDERHISRATVQTFESLQGFLAVDKF